MAAAQTWRGVPLSTLCPKYLHTNSTSHTWPFSAIAELVDNAYDPDVQATQFWIDKTMIKGQECLSFMDNGNGLNSDKMLKMLSFGYSDKTAVNGQEPIGIYGNGFKSGSMRLGRDALVFSKSKDALTIGMLSQSYLEEIKAEQIIIPIVGFQQPSPNKFSVREEHKASLKDILRYSPFKTEVELLNELHAINSTRSSSSATGTRVIVWSLRRTSTGKTEFDFIKDRYDIKIPSDVYETMSEKYKRPERFTAIIPESDSSLRAYCSILYLKPRMQIIIRGQKVKSQLISKSLAYIMKDHYKPTSLNKRVPITFGYNTKSKDQYGIMLYHKNRLIKAYERVGCQLKANQKGVGVIGVIECNFLDPTHNKQDFDNTDKYRRTINSLGIKLEEYWNEIRFKRDREDPNARPLEETMKRPDQNWVQCDTCLNWRKLPDGIDCSLLPDKWFCHKNPDPMFRSCQVEEEKEDSDDDQPSYRKTYKLHEKEDKKEQESQRRKVEEDKKSLENERMSKLAEQNEHLRRVQEDLKRQLSQTTPDPPKSRNTVSRTLGGAVGATASPLSFSTLSQDACSPSSSSSPSTSSPLPIIASVCSLSTAIRMKRTHPVTPPTSESKRARVNGVHRGSAAGASLMIPIDLDDDDDDDITDDDDIVILETGSTPVPKRPCFDLDKVKAEAVSMVIECSDAVDIASVTDTMGTGSTEAAALGTGPSPPPLTLTPPPPPASEQVSITTQTEGPKVKDEEEEEQKRRKGNNDEKKGGEVEQTGGEVEQTGGEVEQSRGEVEQSAEQSASRVNEKGENTEVGMVANVGQKATKPEGGQGSKPEGGQGSNTEAKSGNGTEGTLTNGVAAASHQSDSTVEAGSSGSDRPHSQTPSDHMMRAAQEQQDHVMHAAQEQQDQLLELMQTAAQERDSFKDQVHQLTCQLHDTENALQKLQARTSIKREYSHHATQTEEEEEGGERDYRSLYEQAKQEAETLRREKEGVEMIRVSDEIALQVDGLIRSLDESNRERDALHSKVESLEEEKKTLSTECERLPGRLEEKRPDKGRGSTDQSSTCPPEETEEAAGVSGDLEDPRERLRALRQNVGRLLIAHVPALDLAQDLAQVNYECNVIDEILEQVLDNEESTGGAR